MAKPIEGGVPKRGLYPWDLWLDGRAWEIGPEDFPTVSARSFQAQAKSAGKARGGKVRTRIIDGRVLIQFYTEED